MFFSLCIKRYIKTSRYVIYVTILKYYEDGGGGGATQSERTVVHAEGFTLLLESAQVYFARNAVAEQKMQ